MADEPETTEAGPEDTPSVSALDEKVDRLATAVESILDKLHGGSQQVVERRLDAPGSVAEQVREELARRDREAKLDSTSARVETVAETVAKLTEKTPEAPQRRVERYMFGRR